LPTGTATVGATQSLDRFQHIDRGFHAHHGSGIRDLLHYRNGEAHLGIVDASKRRAAAVVFFRAINGLLTIDPEKFWAPHAEMVATLLNQEGESVAQAVAIKIAKARVQADRLRGLPQFEAVVVASSAKAAAEETDDVLLYECPACGERTATVVGDNEPVVDWDGDDWASTGGVELVPRELRCSLCGLVLDGSDELSAASIPDAIANPRLDPGDLYGDWEPDEDLLRGR
jgi:hypothetical protein